MHGLKLLDEVADLSFLVVVSPVLISTPKKGERMNHYSYLARRWWMTHAPERLSQMEDPEWFFEDLGQTIAVEIEEIRAQLESKMPKDLDYLDQVGRLNSIRRTAEEMVLGELVYPTLDPPSATERLEELWGLLPSVEMIEDAQSRMLENVERDAELDGLEKPMLDQGTQERFDRLSRLSQLLQTPVSSPEEEAEMVDQLEPFLQQM